MAWLELTVEGKKRLFNMDQVAAVEVHHSGRSVLIFAFDQPYGNTREQYSVLVDQDLAAIYNLLRFAGDKPADPSQLSGP